MAWGRVLYTMSPVYTLVLMVGTRGFEPPTPCTPCKCATRLRYVPILPKAKSGIFIQFANENQLF